MIYLTGYIATLMFIIILAVVFRKNAHKTKIKIDMFKSFSVELEDNEKGSDTPAKKSSKPTD